MDKDTQRKISMGKRDALPDAEKSSKNRSIFEKLTENDIYRDAVNVLVYASFGSEVSTDNIIMDCLSQGRNVFCPKVTDKRNRIMEFVRISSLEDLEEGYFHIREPLIDEKSKIYQGQEAAGTVIIMPLVAFDEGCNRAGYGGGFYDRYLARFPGVSTVAIAFECQKTDEPIECQYGDVKPGIIISERKIYKH